MGEHTACRRVLARCELNQITGVHVGRLPRARRWPTVEYLGRVLAF